MKKGHDTKGRFTAGNKEGRGRQVTTLRRAMLDAVTPEDIAAVVKAIIEKAKEGDLQAATMVLDRCIGKPMTAQETELYTYEYDREDYDPVCHLIDFETEKIVPQIRPLRMKG